MNEEPVDILLVEDNQGDAWLTVETLKTARRPCRCQVVSNGEEAMQFLRRQGRHLHAPRPSLILLDLNLPEKDGREVLEEIKADVDLRRIPVVILTTSEAEEDVARAYSLFANGYVTKPPDAQTFQSVIRGIENFWIATVCLPGG